MDQTKSLNSVVGRSNGVCASKEAIFLEDIKTKILDILQAMRKCKEQRRKFLTACRHMQETRLKASLDCLHDIQFKFCRIKVATLSLEENSLLVYDPVDGEDILRRLTRPEHFNADNKDYYSIAQKGFRSGVGAWDTSEYKLALLRSLYQKLLLKTKFAALKHYAHG
jgi:hypothetical protein